MIQRLAVGVVFGLCLSAQAFAQTKVDFGRDVLPIFRQNCFACHGPTLANAGLRLDRKSSAIKQGARRIVPLSSDNSMVFQRLVGDRFGMSMPPTGQLSADKVAIIKNWIDQGATWPDSLSVEAERAPIDPKAVAAVEMLRSGDRKGFLNALAADSKLINARGPSGATPFMFAAMYGDAAILEQLIAKGANVNAKNDAGATALIWAAADLAKTRALVDHKADVNAISDDSRTPVMVAAGVANGLPIVKLLVEHGANLNPTKNTQSESSPLAQSAESADPQIMQFLIDHGADVKASAIGALIMSYAVECAKCVDVLLKQDLPKPFYTPVLLQVANFADAAAIRTLLDRGAVVDAQDPLGHTPLANVVGSDRANVDAAKLLIERGANVNAKSTHPNSGDTGMSILDIAKLRGDGPVTALLIKSGATSALQAAAEPTPHRAASLHDAIQTSLPLLQRADAGFTSKSGCVSCHNDSISAMAIGLARSRGFKLDEKLAAEQVKVNVSFLAQNRETLWQGFMQGVPDFIGPLVFGYVAMGLDAEHYKADLNTDSFAMYIKSHQLPDGHWAFPASDTRPPICSDYVGNTAKGMRALQLYAPAGQKAEYEKAVARAAAWLATARVTVTEDALWKLQGLAWASKDKAAIAKARQEVIALQRNDGGWADVPTIPSGAYSTGRAMVALVHAGMPVSDPVYQRGMQYLLNHQQPDGSWFVRTRALGFQPYFETGFPHGVHQSISAAGTGWAAMALTLGAPASKASSTGGAQ
jgi:ankyrin repeat protein